MNHTTILTNSTRQRCKSISRALPTGGRLDSHLADLKTAKLSSLVRQGLMKPGTMARYVDLRHRYDHIPRKDKQWVHAIDLILRRVRV